jgi:predicted anti-sigma-YlaC factor YlaD
MAQAGRCLNDRGKSCEGVAMKCQDAVDFLADYLEGTLSWRQRLVFELHLAVCRNCRSYLETYSHTIQLTRGWKQAALAPGGIPPVPEELVRAILAARRSGESSLDPGDDGERRSDE